MLSISQIRGDGSYYTAIGKDDYYLNGGEPLGKWLGEGAKALGLSGDVDPQVYQNLMAGFSPDRQTAYFKNSGEPSRRPGTDLTFSAPKSVSELWAASCGVANLERAIREAQWAAVERAMAYLQETVAFGREGLGGNGRVPVLLLWAAFEHGTSRNLDPQLHIHVVLVNTGITEGRARTISTKEIYKAKMAAGAVYRAELASQLRQRLGLALEAKQSWFEVSGVPASLCEAGSSRRHEILEALEKVGFSSAKAAKRAARDTRSAKEIVPREKLFEQWGRIAARHGFGLEQIRNLLRPGHTRVPEQVPARFFTQTVESVLERHSFFSEREIVRGVAEKSQAMGIPVDRILASVRDGLKQLIPLGVFAGERQFTTQATLDLERELIAKALAGRDDLRQTLAHTTLGKILPRHSLSPEQEAALRHMTQRPGTIQVVQGLAGTGKSTALKAAREGYEAEGYQVIGCALSGKAADGLQEASGIPSHTIARLLHQWAKHHSEVPRLNAKTVLVIDEAAMVGTRRLAELLKHAEKACCRVILVGDHRQLPAIEAGAPFRSLGKFLGMAQLTDIRRQFAQWGRDLVREFADGDVRKGVAILQKQGLLHVAPTPEGASRALLTEWAKEINLPKVLILAGTREEVNWLNREAQQLRRDKGKLGAKPCVIGGREFFPGDRVIFGRNDRKLGVKNGTFGTLMEERRGSAIVQLDHESKRVFVPLNHEHVRLGYATTTHKSQGATVERAFVHFSDSMQSREATYVQVSRAREWTKLFLSREQAGEANLRDAIRAMEQSQAKTNAIDLAGTAGLREAEEAQRRRNREREHTHSL